MFRTEPSEDYAMLSGFIAYLFEGAYHAYGFDAAANERFFDALIREELLNWMCLYNFEDCVETAQGKFMEWMDMGSNAADDNNPIDADIKSPVYETAIR